MKLSEALGVPRGVTAIVGSGGKTTAMYLLSEVLSERSSVLCCTTTRIYPPAHIPVVMDPDAAALRTALEKCRCVCAGLPAAEGKLAAPALPMGELAELADYVLVEADGSRGLPLKAHLPHEPVIPPESGLTVLLVGASGLGQPVERAVHRAERFCQLSGLEPGQPVTPQDLAAVINAEHLTDTIFINQAESAGAMAGAGELARLLEAGTVFAGSLQRREWICLR